MGKFLKVGGAIALGLMIGLSLFSSGAFAQGVNTNAPGKTASQVAVATQVLRGIKQTGQIPLYMRGHQGPVNRWYPKRWWPRYNQCVNAYRYGWYRSYGRWYRRGYWACR